jgi:hypothetical protein
MAIDGVFAESSSLHSHPQPVAPRLAGSSAASPAGVETQSRRLGLWQIDGGAQCSIIGTCLSDRDLREAVRKHLPSFDKRASNYEVHCHCAHASQIDGPLARTLTKMLNRRYAGAVNLAGKMASEAEVIALWLRLRDAGNVAAGYWAIMSHREIANNIKQRVFGEIHMLSHLHGRSIHQLTTKLAEMQRRCTELEGRLARSETARQTALSERDTALAAGDSLREMLAEREAQARNALPEGSVARTLARLREELAQRERALLIARTRARQAEAGLERLETESRQQQRVSALRPRSPDAEQASVPAAPPADLAGTRILYVGGRNAVVPHLHSVAAAYAAELLHHDGGVEDSMHRIVEMVERCDAVICPVDCVSHGACRLAKSSCMRLNRVFLPVQTASRACFERALMSLSSLPRSTVRAPA